MSIPPMELDLAADFPSSGAAEQWSLLVEKALKGADFEKQLIARSADGIRIKPLYMQSASERSLSQVKAAQPWAICLRIDHPDPVLANRLALADLQGGASVLSLVTPDAIGSYGYGVELNSIEDVKRLFSDIELDMIQLRLEPSANGKRWAALIAAFLMASGAATDKFEVNFGLDPIAALLRNGSLDVAKDALMRDLSSTILELRDRGFTTPIITCDVRPVHEAGGSEAQELAVALAMGVEYLRGLSQNGHTLTEASQALSWTIALDADQFMGLAKLRALRLLWRRVEETSGLSHLPIHIHAETAWRMMSKLDSTVNILRATMATAAASFGGADSICVLPYTQPLGLPDELARRIARNTQIVLAEEANLWRVADPGAGSGACEALTDDLCQAAWAIFQQIEAEGGIIESFQTGALQARVTTICKARQRDIAHCEVALTGTSAFPNLAAPASKHVLDVAPRPICTSPSEACNGGLAVTFDELVKHFRRGTHLSDTLEKPSASIKKGAALPSVRLSEPFEALRDSADQHALLAGNRATVFLAHLGPVADHGTRAMWIRNFLAAGGLEGTTHDGFMNANEVGQAFTESATLVACICGTDKMYTQQAEQSVQILKQAGAAAIYLVGNPGPLENVLIEAGVDGFFFAGIDVLAALTQIHHTLALKHSD